MALAIESLRERTDAEGQGTLAYILLCAGIEAKVISARARGAEEERKAGPDEIWQPV